MNFSVGDLIGGRYKIYRIFGGEGASGMGVVYVCHDQKKGGVLALKTYQQRFFNDRSLSDSFKRGALAWIQLEQHPYIVQAYGVFELAGRLFLGLEYIAPDGEDRNTLTHHLRGRISLEKALGWALHFCDGISHAHSRGITPHRDIKPDNLMITSHGTLKVSDYDLAGIGQSAALPETMVNDNNATPGLTFIKAANGKMVAGTPPWMAPEQFWGDAGVTSDIYSFGVVLYQMMARGRLPIMTRTGDWESAHMNQVPEPLPKLPLWPIIERCLDKEPSRRFGANGNFDDFRAALVELWEREMPNKAIPHAPVGKAMEAADHCNKGVSLAKLGMQREALAEYKKAIALKPDYPAAYLNIGVTLVKVGKPDEALKAYIKAIRLDPNLAEAYNNYGLLLKQRGRVDEAEKAYRKALKLDPGLGGAYENLGVILSESGRHDESVSMCSGAVDRDPTNPAHQYALGVCLEKVKRFEEALQHYREAVKLAPHSSAYLYGLGNGYRFLGDMQQAVDCWEEAASIDPGHSMVRFNLGIAYEKAGYKELAHGYYHEAIRIDPNNPNPYYNYGLMLSQDRLYGLGADAFEKFAALASGTLASHIPTAQGYVKEMRADEAEYQQLMTSSCEAVYNRGLAHLNLGRLDEARPFFEQALTMNPDYANALCGLGIWHEKMNDFAAAADCYRRSISADPEYIIAWNNLGWASYNSGDFATAKEAYNKYIEVAPAEQAAWVDDAQKILDDIVQRESAPPPPPGAM